MLESFFVGLSFWHWIILAVILFVLELITGSGFMLWVAIGAIISAVFVGVFPSLYWAWQVLLFSCFSLIACFGWWRFLKTRTEASDKPLLNQRGQQLVGRSFDLSDAIVNGRGKVRVGDTFWLVEGEDLPEGTKVNVECVDGVVLKVRKA